ncbi:MAG: hypothetical protein GDA44_08680 [Prochloron sp. SP5CPC1]|nr:hypothetical protein [Candidatus Paraprochloron terpiosi SP5CPC1]
MAKSSKIRRNVNSQDPSVIRVTNISSYGTRFVGMPPLDKTRIEIDREVVNLLNWLSQEQGLPPEMALKKAVVTAAYFQDLTTYQRGKLLVQNPDKSINEILL